MLTSSHRSRQHAPRACALAPVGGKNSCSSAAKGPSRRFGTSQRSDAASRYVTRTPRVVREGLQFHEQALHVRPQLRLCGLRQRQLPSHAARLCAQGALCRVMLVGHTRIGSDIRRNPLMRAPRRRAMHTDELTPNMLLYIT